jgi:hypothetical protein
MKWTRILQVAIVGLAFLLPSQHVLAQSKNVVVIPMGGGGSGADNDWTVSGTHMYNNNSGHVGIGIESPGQKLHLADGNFLLEGGEETAVQIKRDFTIANASHPQSPFPNPIFKIGRIIEGGDGAPQFRWLYEDDTDVEHVVMELDSEGIMSSVRRAATPGSHFEAHLSGDTHPLFRLNSHPYMQLQMGAGGSSDTDVAVARTDSNNIALFTNGTQQLTVDENGDVGIGTTSPEAKLHVAGKIKATELETGDIKFRKDGKILWRMFEDEKGLYLENIQTGETSAIFLEKDLKILKAEKKALELRLAKIEAILKVGK